MSRSCPVGVPIVVRSVSRSVHCRVHVHVQAVFQRPVGVLVVSKSVFAVFWVIRRCSDGVPGLPVGVVVV